MYIGHSKNDYGQYQLYKDHVINVLNRSLSFFDKTYSFFTGTIKEWNCLWNALYLACLYHDLGKLDTYSQYIMKEGHSDDVGKMLNHVDAGVSYLLYRFKLSIEKKNMKIEFLYASILIHAHHLGILNLENMDFIRVFKDNECIRDKKKVIDRNDKYFDFLLNKDEETKDYVDRNLDKWVDIHNKEIGIEEELKDSSFFDVIKYPLTLRILLSCLVEGDHYDTADHYGQAIEIIPSELKAKERLNLHLEKRKSFKNGASKAEISRNKIRNSVFNDCFNASLDNSIFHISATPGNGKTQGGDCLSKRIAIENGARKIFKIAPFSNIIIQNVMEVKKFNVLKGEKEDEVVGEHHHQADYFSKATASGSLYKKSKELNTLWKCPIEFTSSVQFFETMASNWPSKLRKFNMVPGSVIEVDEYHTCIPLNKIRQTFLWMKELSDLWSCKFVLMSGSPISFWKLKDLNSCEISPEEVCEVLSEKTIKLMEHFEEERIRFINIKKPLSFQGLYKKVKEEPGPRVVICNTVLTAAKLANKFRLLDGKEKVMHISTALSPKDREKVYQKIKNRLDDKTDTDWTLIATSCIDTGVNFSFKVGFRESSSLMSSQQLGGRVNRNGEMGKTCNVFIFKIDHFMEGTTNNPSFLPSIRVLDRMIERGKTSYLDCSEAIAREIQERNLRLKEIEEYEVKLNFYEVVHKYKMITAHYRTVVVDRDIIEKLKIEFIHPKEILKNSVQIYFTKLEREEYLLNIISHEFSPEIIEQQKDKKINMQNEYHVWDGQYCPDFLGYMKEILYFLGENVDY